MVPARTPKQTNHYHRKEQIRALGKNNPIHAIKFVMAEYKQKLKKNPQFKYNSANIANLNEYNELWRDFPIKHIKAPSNAAAVATTQSAICRLVCEGAPQQPQSGIHLAKKIIKQAKSIICWNSGSDPNSTQESPKRRSVIVTSMEGAEG
ncbi:hypothetical protein H4Q26_009335 [Puccinia striiformis f. sp. tritici PST-130]|nr:hypothetical protein H4Q26_009335 [Puccinia striiformis f. sp. tritici PST-130]